MNNNYYTIEPTQEFKVPHIVYGNQMVQLTNKYKLMLELVQTGNTDNIYKKMPMKL